MSAGRLKILFDLQDGLCPLAITEACRRRERRIELTNKGTRKGAHATIEHVFPNAKRWRGVPALVVASCAQCNNAKGDEMPSAEYLAVAIEITRRRMKREPAALKQVEEQVAAYLADPLAFHYSAPATRYHPPPCGYDPPLSSRYKPATFSMGEIARMDDEARDELARQIFGVTDPAYLPSARTREREERDAAARAQRDEWRANGLAVMAPSRRESSR